MAVNDGTERQTIPPATVKVCHLHIVIAGRREGGERGSVGGRREREEREERRKGGKEKGREGRKGEGGRRYV